MQLITCPWCGPRDEIEFGYGGAPVRYPADPSSMTDAEWAQFLFHRPNVKGPMREQWRHAVGCGRWFEAVRNTVTYRFEPTAAQEN